MTISELVSKSGDFVSTSTCNFIHEKNDDVRIFEQPIFGFGSPDDLLFEKFTLVVSEGFMMPRQWLTSARTVVSFFLPYCEVVKKSNAEDMSWPSDIWLYARYEGQIFVRELAKNLCNLFEDHGAKSVAPSADPKFKTGDGNNRFTSNWSERHVAYACGLGTFGLSKGLITNKGICGRFGSIVTELDFPKTERNYTGVYDNCNNCGDCINNCPANAISYEDGKKDLLCSNFLDKTLEKHKPRYGCGKCQVGVSCESKVP